MHVGTVAECLYVFLPIMNKSARKILLNGANIFRVLVVKYLPCTASSCKSHKAVWHLLY